MHRPIVLWVCLGNSAPVKGITRETAGLTVKVSVLKRAAEKLANESDFTIGTSARMIFHTDEYGDTPGIGGRLVDFDRLDQSLELSIEIDEWDRLASFWDSVMRH